MKTTVQHETRRRNISDYERIIKAREEREAKDIAVQEDWERQNKMALAEASQGRINEICQDIQEKYTAMVNAGKEMKECQKQLSEKLKEDELFHATTPELYPIKEVDESQDRRMAILRVAYHGLPILDSIFAFLALSPIITSKIARSSSLLSGFAEPVGVITSLLIGYGLSLLSRLAVSSMSDKDSPRVHTFKILATGGAMMCLPLTYMLGEFYFNDGQSWPYSVCFAFISLIIQLLMVFGYKQQNEALHYFRIKERNKAMEATKQADENAIRRETDEIRNRIQKIVTTFESDYAAFTQKFRELAAARDEHILKFGEEAKLYVNQLVIYIGNLFCFRRQVIPLYLAADGSVASMPFVNFPDVEGTRDIYTISDFLHIDSMLKRTWLEESLTETNRIVEERKSESLNAASSQNNKNGDRDETQTVSDDNPGDDDTRGSIW